MNALQDFLDFMHKVDAPPARSLEIGVTNKRIGRYRVLGEKNGKRSGAYQFDIISGRPVGWVRDHRVGVTHIYKPNREPLTAEEREYFERRRREKREAEQRTWLNAAREIDALVKTLPAADPGHDYLKRKGIKPHRIKQQDDALIIPLYSIGGRIWNAQRIWPDGKKRYMPDAMIMGTFHPICSNGHRERIIITEGFATGATIHEQTGLPVACAMQACNLPRVTKAILKKYQHADVLIAADNDQWSVRPNGQRFNAGIHYASAACTKNRARFTVPDVPHDDPEKRTDFNDLHTSGVDISSIFSMPFTCYDSA